MLAVFENWTAIDSTEVCNKYSRADVFSNSYFIFIIMNNIWKKKENALKFFQISIFFPMWKKNDDKYKSAF